MKQLFVFLLLFLVISSTTASMNDSLASPENYVADNPITDQPSPGGSDPGDKKIGLLPGTIIVSISLLLVTWCTNQFPTAYIPKVFLVTIFYQSNYVIVRL
ncbi:hypothetical protein GCM10007216_05990 [Thalassobacillus devorans]|uniref:Uncharacterized protein n=1 Tax=Thalassobacillus devorans TaxID=279813 RepID=A0ABQ1NIN9_9BACI|nr:hypothetical protein [Thalassobacillus devorans]NIK27511.1 hypothetical protein [Thalassobacillus devorans]GGC78264.1 hypothetical protein GCM10007216_05990 [Thalassobacillus devorans]